MKKKKEFHLVQLYDNVTPLNNQLLDQYFATPTVGLIDIHMFIMPAKMIGD